MAAPIEGHVVVAGRNSPGVLRKGVPGESKALKEKVILYYESILKGEDPSRKHPRFWEEFFLLKVNVDYLIKRFDPMPAPELVQLKSTINLLFAHCVRALNTEDSTIRYVNALQTLCTLIKVIFKKTGSTNSSGFDVLDVLIGFESAECHMQNLVDSLNTILTSDSPVSLKNLALKLILIIITVSDNISQNVLMEYLMVNSLFESLMAIFSHPESRDQHGADTSLVLTILVNYRKFEAANPYVIKLSVLDDELALNGLGWIIGNALFEYNSQYHSLQEQPQGWLGTLSHMVGSMWTSSSVPTTVEALRINESILLALYEAVHLNRNFITILTHTKSPLSPRTPPGVPIAVASSVAAVQALGSPGLPSPPSQPANLLGMFLTFSSIVLQNTKVERCHAHARLSLVILTCITEDQFANSFLHDTNISFPVTLYRAPFLHRKVKTDKNKKSVPLACSLLDLMVEFTLSHLSKGLLVDLHSKCLGIIHRVLCYQKRCRVRLDYDWKELWTALINLMKFLVSNEDFLLPSSDIFALIYQVSIIFNLFITYGDTFLPSPATYDELYYEIMRTMEVFESVHTMVSSHASSSSSPGLQESASRTLPSLKNIQSIVTHYAPKMAAWKAFNPGASMDHDQVLEVIRTNYDTLTLKLQDNLDYFEKYSERPNESGFFSQLLRMVVTECRDGLSLANLQQKIVLSELASMPGPTSN